MASDGTCVFQLSSTVDYGSDVIEPRVIGAQARSLIRKSMGILAINPVGGLATKLG